MAEMNRPKLWRSGRTDPFRAMSTLQGEIDRLFDHFLEPDFELGLGSKEIEFVPECDVDETDTHYLLSFDLPGISKDQVKVEVADNVLTVSGERKEERKAIKTGRSEKFRGYFKRSMTLPGGVNADQVKASYENGVLEIAVPKMESAKPKLIKIGESPLAIGESRLDESKQKEKGKAA